MGIYAGLHLQIARLTDSPEIALSEDDARVFLDRLQNVLRHYPIGASQKAVDWAAFVGVTSFIYLPRFAAIAKRKAEAASPPPPRQTAPQTAPGASVFQFHPQGPGNGSGQPFSSPPPVPPTVEGEIADPPMDIPLC